MQSVEFLLIAFKSDWTKIGQEHYSLAQSVQLAGPVEHTTVQVSVDSDILQDAETIIVMPSYGEVFSSSGSVFQYGWQLTKGAVISIWESYSLYHSASSFSGGTVSTQLSPNGWCEIKCAVRCEWCEFMCWYLDCDQCGCHCSAPGTGCRVTCIFGFCRV